MSLDYYLECVCCGETIFFINITHNLIEMAKFCIAGNKDLYQLLWEYEKRNTLSYRRKVSEGLKFLLENREHLEIYNSPNGWGTYEGFKEFVVGVVEALFKYPETQVRVCT